MTARASISWEGSTLEELEHWEALYPEDPDLPQVADFIKGEVAKWNEHHDAQLTLWALHARSILRRGQMSKIAERVLTQAGIEWFPREADVDSQTLRRLYVETVTTCMQFSTEA